MGNSKYSIDEYKFVKRMIVEGVWQKKICNGYPVFWAKRAGKFIDEFVSKGDNFCPHFKVIGVASGSCHINCHGCFLKGTYRKMRIPGSPVLYTNFDDLVKELDKQLATSKNTVFSDGERCDSLLYDGDDFPATKALHEIFKKNKENGNKWLRLTKSANVDHLLDLDHQEVMILSYSLNPQSISEIFEANQVASILERLKAAKKGQEAGYPTRLRIDPVIKINNWKTVYKNFLCQIETVNLKPEVITLGTYRIIERSVHSLKMLGDTPAVDLKKLEPIGISKEQRRMRYPDKIRQEIYKYIIEQIKLILPGTKIGLCKETQLLRSQLGFTENDIACNCTIF